MADYRFFFSYSSLDRNVAEPESDRVSKHDTIRIFFTDLCNEIRHRDIGFMDRKSIEGRWRSELVDGLASSRILVPLYSPNYFRSEHCGKEWAVFHERSLDNARHRFPDVTTQVICPVLWRAPLTIPESVNDFQFDRDGEPQMFKDFGLEYIMRFRRSTLYKEFVHRFARRLERHAEEQGEPKIRYVPDYDQIEPTFPGGKVRGLKGVRYLLLAGVKNEMKTLRSRLDCYGEFADRRDWLPCFPDIPRRAEQIVTGPAKDEARYPQIEILGSNETAIARQLHEARDLNNLLIVLVDPWSIKLPQFHLLATLLEREEFANSAVLVTWNLSDSETEQKYPELKNIMSRYFLGRPGRNEFYKDSIQTELEIVTSIREAFNAIRSRLIESGKIASADPTSIEGKPNLTNSRI